MSSEQTQIDEAHAARLFLESDAGKAVLGRLKKATYAAWCDAPDVETREKVHLRGQAITDLVNELVRTIAVGEDAMAVRDDRETKEEKAKK